MVSIGGGDGGCGRKSAGEIGDGFDIGKYEISRGGERVAKGNCMKGVGSESVGWLK